MNISLSRFMSSSTLRAVFTFWIKKWKNMFWRKEEIMEFLYRQLLVWNFMPKFVANIFSNWRCFRTRDQFHLIRGIHQGDMYHLVLFHSSIVNVEFYAQFCDQHFSKAGDVSRDGTISLWWGGSPSVTNPFGVRTGINYQFEILWRGLLSPHFSELTKIENLGLVSSD